MREWGRIGNAGRERSISLTTPHEAQVALEHQRRVKKQRGYVQANG